MEGSVTGDMARPPEDMGRGVPAGCSQSGAPGKQRGPTWATAFEPKPSDPEDLPNVTCVELRGHL